MSHTNRCYPERCYCPEPDQDAPSDCVCESEELQPGECTYCKTIEDIKSKGFKPLYNTNGKDIFTLKSCPFCGSRSIAWEKKGENGASDTYGVGCSGFDFCEIKTDDWSRLDDAVKGWNRRLIR